MRAPKTESQQTLPPTQVFAELKSAWTLGDRAGGPPALSSGGAWGPHSEGRQGVWEATLVHQLCPALGISWRQTCAVGMVGHPGLACEHRGCHWAEGLALSSSGGVQGRLRARVVLTSWGQRVRAAQTVNLVEGGAFWALGHKELSSN